MHPGSWVAWLALVMSAALTTSNPLYLVVVLLTIMLVGAMAPRTGEPVVGVRVVFGFGVGIFALSLAVAIVNGSFGDHVLFTVPGPEIPRWLGGLSIGGPVSAEGLVAAGIRGLSILCVIAAFATFNRAVTPQRVLRTAPAALFHAGLVVTIGLALLPATVADVRRIREMRALRGAPTGIRSSASLLVPALIGGLDRAMRTAEAMEARGYAAANPLPRHGHLLLSIAPAFVLLGAWLWFFYPSLKAAGAAAALAGAGLVVVAAVQASRARTTTRLKRERYHPLERGVAIGSVLLAAALVLAGGQPLDFDYNPFAGLEAPHFELLEALLLLAGAWPVAAFLLGPASPRQDEQPAAALTERPT